MSVPDHEKSNSPGLTTCVSGTFSSLRTVLFPIPLFISAMRTTTLPVPVASFVKAPPLTKEASDDRGAAVVPSSRFRCQSVFRRQSIVRTASMFAAILSSREPRTDAIADWLESDGSEIGYALKLVVGCAIAGTPVCVANALRVSWPSLLRIQYVINRASAKRGSTANRI